jgi:hypothetical protein
MSSCLSAERILEESLSAPIHQPYEPTTFLSLLPWAHQSDLKLVRSPEWSIRKNQNVNQTSRACRSTPEDIISSMAIGRQNKQYVLLLFQSNEGRMFRDKFSHPEMWGRDIRYESESTPLRQRQLINQTVFEDGWYPILELWKQPVPASRRAGVRCYCCSCWCIST